MSIFSGKLDRLGETVALALEVASSRMAAAIDRYAASEVILVGSGGSAVTAEFFAACRDGCGDATTTVHTPMSYVLRAAGRTEAPVWLFSAGGANPDALAAFEAAAASACRGIEVVTSNPGGALGDMARRCPRATVHPCPVAEPKDGFLATHTLVSSIVLLVRAFDLALCGDPHRDRKSRLGEAVARSMSPIHRSDMAGRLGAVLGGDVLVLLHDPRLAAAAVLVETSFWEAAISPVQRTDFRNFAHGRHVWFGRHGDATGVLALVAEGSRSAWDQVSAALPTNPSRVALDFGFPGRQALFEAVLEALVIVEAAGAVRGIDPGRPGVEAYGRPIYESRALLDEVRSQSPPLRLKQSARAVTDAGPGTDTQSDREAFLEGLAGARFAGLVLDWDGTVVESGAGMLPPEPCIVGRLAGLLDQGLAVAFASGRGGSLGEVLRRIVDRRHWDSVLVGYYNGMHVAPLSCDIRDHPPRPHEELSRLDGWLTANLDLLPPGVTHRFSNVQVTIQDSRRTPTAGLVEAMVAAGFGIGTSLVARRSAHSLDIGPSGTGKARVLEALEAGRGIGATALLCIGDSGDWQGNDHDLLSTPYSLSVGTVCHRGRVCWNLLPGGTVGPMALRCILEALTWTADGARLDVRSLLAPSP